MRLTDSQISFIKEHVDERYIDLARLLKYLEAHKNVGNSVFEYSSKIERRKDFKFVERGFDEVSKIASGETVDRELFIKRIPYLFYIPPEGERLRMYHYFPREKEADIEAFYADMDLLYYDMKFSLREIFEYPATQTSVPESQRLREGDDWITADLHFKSNPYVTKRDVFPQWVHYIKLCTALGWTDYFPERFITAYNHALEASGLEPIIYKAYEGPYPIGAGGPYRDGLTFTCEGRFPCDESGKPIMRWTNIDVHKANVSFDGERSDYGNLVIHLTPKTVINVLYDGDTEYTQIYTGPQTVEFDNEALKNLRKEAGMSQPELANAIGVSPRTLQKWEYGDTVPDGYHLLRIMNWLNIYDIQSFTKIVDTDDEEDTE